MNTVLKEIIDKNIETSGQHLFGVFDPNGVDTAFIYPIGNALRGLPELLIIGDFNPNALGSVLNVMGDMMRKREQPFLEGSRRYRGNIPPKVRKCGELAKAKYTIQAGEYLGRQDYDVMQVLVPDTNGKYPGDIYVEMPYDVEMP